MSACLMEEIAAAQDLENQWVFCPPQMYLTVSLEKKVKADPRNDVFSFLFFKGRMEQAK